MKLKKYCVYVCGLLIANLIFYALRIEAIMLEKKENIKIKKKMSKYFFIF